LFLVQCSFGAIQSQYTLSRLRRKKSVPVYEYRCEKCGNEYEKREGFDAPARQRCPKCKGKALRVLRPAAVVFKGSGFYVTDNRKSESAPATESASNSTKSDDGASTKPAEKSTADKSTSESAAAS
jgi:putative FmdB family regulatory protein